MSSSSPHSADRLGIILAIGGAVLFSAKGLLVKFAYADGMSSIAVVTLRMLIAVPFFIAFGYGGWKRRRPVLGRHDYLMLLICGVIGYYLAAWLSFYGLNFISVQLERLILFSYPVLVVIATAVIRREWPEKRIVAAATITYLGILMVFGHDFRAAPPGAESHAIAYGSLMVFLSAVSFAAYVILSKPMISKMGSRFFTAAAMTVSGVAVITHAILSVLKNGGADGFVTTPRAYLAVTAIALIGTVIPAFMINEGLARLGPARNSILGTAGPVATSLLAVPVLGEAFTVWHLFALVCCGAGVTLIARQKVR